MILCKLSLYVSINFNKQQITLVNKYCKKSYILEGFQTLMFRPEPDPTKNFECRIRSYLENRIRIRHHFKNRIRNPVFMKGGRDREKRICTLFAIILKREREREEVEGVLPLFLLPSFSLSLSPLLHHHPSPSLSLPGGT